MDEMKTLERIVALESQMRNEVAKQSWVHEILVPIRDAMVRQESTLSSLAKDTQHLYSAHDELLKDRAEREREEHEEKMNALRDKTFTAMIKNHWQPVIASLVGLSVLLSVFGAVIHWYLTHVFK